MTRPMRILLGTLAFGAYLAIGGASPALASCGRDNPNCVAPTPPTSDNSSRIANTAWVNQFINSGLPLAQGKIYIGSAGGIAAAQTPSGDCTLSVSGVITCTQSAGNFTVNGVISVTGGELLTNIVAPATPGAGDTRVYVDSTNKVLSAKNDAGTVSNTVVPSTAPTHQWFNSLSAAGVLGASQPACGDLSNAAASCSTDATNASNISSGTLPAARLPAPTATTLGGIESYAAVAHQWINSISTAGVPSASQPSFADISGTASPSQIPAPTATSLGGIESYAAVANQWINSISTAGAPSSAQPACGDLSNSTSYCSAAIGQLPGTTTNDSATAGNIGEYVSSSVASGSAVALTTASAKTIAAVTLTPGDWDVTGVINYNDGTSSTTITSTFCTISTTANSLDSTTPGATVGVYLGSVSPGGGYVFGQNCSTIRFSVSANTTVNLNAFSVFGTSTLSAWGIIRARRVR